MSAGTGASPEEPLLPKVASGDPLAMEACIDRYGGLVWSAAQRFSRSRTEAEDATQDVFLALWTSASSFDPAKASERTFVAMIVRRRLIDRRRADSRRPPVAIAGDQELSAIPSDAHVQLERMPEASRAIAALDSLPDDRQKVVRLAVLEGLTHDEIATATGLPLGTVKSHVKRGLAAVRDAVLGDASARAAKVTR